MKCSYCIAHDLPSGTLSRTDVYKSVNLLKWLAQGASSAEITFTGGEPLLVIPVFKSAVRYADSALRTIGIKTAFVVKTNGTLLTESLIDFLREYKVKVVVSIDGLANTHNKYRRTKKNIPTKSMIHRNLEMLMKHDVNCVASITVHPDFSDEVYCNVRHLHGLGIESIDVGPAYGTVIWSDEDAVSFSQSLLKVARLIREVKLSGGKLEVGPIYQASEHVGGILRDIWGCHAGSTNIAFMPNGQISGCSSLAMISKRYPELIIGDINRGIYTDNAKHLAALAQADVEQRRDCQKCITSLNCSGGCLAINISQNGMPFTPPSVYCQAISKIPMAWACAWGA